MVAIQNDIPVTVVCSNRDVDGSQLDVQQDRWTSFENIPVYYSSKGYKNFKAQLAADSTLFINGIYSLQYNFFPLLFFKGRKIVSVRGMLHPGALSQKTFKKKIYLQAWKALRLHTKCEYHATSEQEKVFIQQVFGRSTKVWVIPNLPNTQQKQPMPVKEDTLVVASIALISPMKNYLLVLQALQRCKQKIIYRIHGPVKDEAYWNECLKAIAQMPGNIKVEYKGEIEPHKIPEALAQIHVYIQPSKSENFGHSLFEALTTGRPVITSNFTPWNDLEKNKAGFNVDIDSTVEINSAITCFAGADSEMLAEWGGNAREYALGRIDVERIKEQYVEMFRSG